MLRNNFIIIKNLKFQINSAVISVCLLLVAVPGGEESASVTSGVSTEIVIVLNHGAFIFSAIAFSVGAFTKCSTVCAAEVLLMSSVMDSMVVSWSSVVTFLAA